MPPHGKRRESIKPKVLKGTTGKIKTVNADRDDIADKTATSISKQVKALAKKYDKVMVSYLITGYTISS